MYKYILVIVFSISISYGQTTLDSLLNKSWDVSKSEFLNKFNITKYEEKEAMGYSGYKFNDSLEHIDVEIVYLFNATGNQAIRGISNKIKSEESSKKFFNFLYSALNKLLGEKNSDNDMLGARIIHWKNHGGTVMLNYSSDTCMLTIIK